MRLYKRCHSHGDGIWYIELSREKSITTGLKVGQGDNDARAMQMFYQIKKEQLAKKMEQLTTKIREKAPADFSLEDQNFLAK
jgi:hypothetical protein